MDAAGFECWDVLSDLEPAPEVALCKNCLLMVAELNRLTAGGGWCVEDERLVAGAMLEAEAGSLAAVDDDDDLG